MLSCFPRRFRAALLVALVALPSPRPLDAWDGAGHELVATIAYGRLNAKARKAVSDLAGQMDSPGHTYNAVTLACWMDDLRKDAAMPEHGLFLSWHYIDLGVDPGDPPLSMEPGDDNEAHGNVVQALKRAMVVLQGGTDPYITTQAMACAMVMHLVGDIHQPLHCATKYFISGGRQHQDAGGNKERVDNGPWGDEKFNLHAFWDSAWRATFDEASGRVELDSRLREDGGHDPSEIESLARALALQTLPPGVSLETDFDGWARESNGIARDFVYRDVTATESKKYCRLSRAYVAQANALARQRLLLAGYRLAALLNRTLGSDIPARPAPAYPAGPPGPAY